MQYFCRIYPGEIRNHQNQPTSPQSKTEATQIQVPISLTLQTLNVWPSPHPGGYQRKYSDKELGDDRVDLDQFFEEQNPQHNPFLSDEAGEPSEELRNDSIKDPAENDSSRRSSHEDEARAIGDSEYLRL